MERSHLYKKCQALGIDLRVAIGDGVGGSARLPCSWDEAGARSSD
jgi:hypothetical protein